MQIYLVGGAVRDEILGIEPKDRDYVVVGSSEEEMLAQGFEKVGLSFPIFIHPETYEQYALARTEVKSGKGYSGFTVDADSKISLVDDLRRRDLTINSMAKDLSTGEVIDPFGGKRDIEDKVLRHTSSAFSEDALRVIRVANLYARLSQFGFTIHTKTFKLCKKMVKQKMLDELQYVRFWLILAKTVEEPNFNIFIKCLKDLGVFSHSKFFSGLIKKKSDILRLVDVASAVNQVCEYYMESSKVIYFTMSICPEDSKSLHTFASKNLHSAFCKLKDAKKITPVKLLNVLSSARAFEHKNYHLGELIMLVKIQELAGNSMCVSSTTLKQINSALQSVPRELVDNDDGEKIKKKINKYRLSTIKHILVNQVNV